jgi:hypothetical protein
MDTPTTAARPVFANKSDQLRWIVRRFILYGIGLARESGLEGVPTDDEMGAMYDAIPSTVVVKYCIELDKMLGQAIETENMSGVAQLAAIAGANSPGPEMMQGVNALTTALLGDDAKRKKFFSYLKIVRRVLHSPDGSGAGAAGAAGGVDDGHTPGTPGGRGTPGSSAKRGGRGKFHGRGR